MRRLLLIRHAKSSWDDPSLDDHDRPLNKRGKRDAPLMAKQLLSSGEKLDAVISSTAVRALGIAEPIANALATPLIKNPNLYTFSSRELFAEIGNIPDRYQRVAIVGHNPAITALANDFLSSTIDNVPTSGVVAFHCEISHWHELAPNTCRMDYFIHPKKITY